LDSAQIPVLGLESPAQEFAEAIGQSFRRFGFAVVRDHGIDSHLIAEAWDLTAEFFARPEAEKLQWFDSALAGARGYTPFGREIAKGAERARPQGVLARWPGTPARASAAVSINAAQHLARSASGLS